MAETRQFIGDEIHMMASDIAILRNENELLKMTSERKAEENRILRADLVELRAKYEEKVAESASLYTILNSTAQSIHHGLQKYMEQRSLRKEHEQAQKPAAPARAPEPPPPVDTRGTNGRTRAAALSDEATRVMPQPARVPVARGGELANEEAPAFLRRPGLPPNEFRSDADDLRMVADQIGKRSEQ